MINFIVGLILGGSVGDITMCLMQSTKNRDSNFLK